MGRRRTPRDLLTPAALHMLLALARGDLHGYGIKQDVEERTKGRLRLRPGTLYEAIHRMEADGWIREVPDPDGDGNRKVYRITDRGRAVMQEELRRLAEIVRFARDEDLLPEAGAFRTEAGALPAEEDPHRSSGEGFPGTGPVAEEPA